MKSDVSAEALAATRSANTNRNAVTLDRVGRVCRGERQASPSNEMDPPAAAAIPRLACNIRDACTVLGVGRTSLYDLAKKRKLKLIKIAGRTVVPWAELERLARGEEAA